jgi:hypothetical protein
VALGKILQALNYRPQGHRDLGIRREIILLERTLKLVYPEDDADNLTVMIMMQAIFLYGLDLLVPFNWSIFPSAFGTLKQRILVLFYISLNAELFVSEKMVILRDHLIFNKNFFCQVRVRYPCYFIAILTVSLHFHTIRTRSHATITHDEGQLSDICISCCATLIASR